MEKIHVCAEGHDILVVEDHGLTRDVGRGHDECILSQLVEEHHLHACVGQENTDVVESGGDDVVDREVPLLGQDDGTEGRGQLFLLFGSRVAVFPCGFQILHHDGEGFLFPAVPFPHAGGVGKSAADVHPAPAFGDTDLPFAEHLCEFRYGVSFDGFSVLSHQAVLRTAGRAADCLMVESSVGRGRILPAAGGAYGEFTHGRAGPVVGQ